MSGRRPGDGDPPPRIVISSDDLDDLDDLGPTPSYSAPPTAAPPPSPAGYPAAPPTAAAPPPPPAGYPAAPPAATPLPPPGNPLPPLTAAPPPLAVPGAGLAGGSLSLASLGANSVVAGLVAGVVGGAVGAIAAEILNSPDRSDSFSSPSAIRVDTGVWVAIVGIVLGFTLLAWEGLTSSSLEKAGRDGLVGAGIGAVAGFIGGYVAQWLYASMLESASSGDIESKLLVARVVGWAIFGAIVGLGMGIPGGQRKMVNGLIGGTVGGAVGGFLFEQVAQSASSGSGFTLRFVGLTATGAGIGLGIGVVDRLRREAWVRFNAGPMAGKEFILFRDATTVGADYRCDIVLAKDETVLPRHAVLARDARGMTTLQAEPGAAVAVNGAPATQHRLHSGDTVTIGRSGLLFQERVT